MYRQQNIKKTHTHNQIIFNTSDFVRQQCLHEYVAVLLYFVLVRCLSCTNIPSSSASGFCLVITENVMVRLR